MVVPNSKDELQDKGFWLALLAEFGGTLLYVLFGCGIYQAAVTEPLSVAAGFGLAAGVLLWVFQHVSGGHFNPAVSFGFLITRRVSLVRGIFYFVAQIIGGILGNLLLKGLSKDDAELGLLAPKDGIRPDQAFGVELFITLIFVFTYFAFNDPGRSHLNGSAPVTIALSSVLVHLFALGSTGSGLNPARAFAPAVVRNEFETTHWVYWVGPLLGGVIAAFLYEFLFASNACLNKFLAFFTRDYDNDNDFSAPRESKKKPADAEAPAEKPAENGKEGEAAEPETKAES